MTYTFTMVCPRCNKTAVRELIGKTEAHAKRLMERPIYCSWACEKENDGN